MRRALLFMIFLNSITCVTENLAMNVESSKDDIELFDTENQAPEKKIRTPQKRKSRCRKEAGRWCKVITTGALFLSLGSVPYFLSAEGTEGMNEVASRITVYTGNYTEKPNCTYRPYSSSRMTDYMKGECKKSEEGWYKCVVEECEDSEQYKKSYQMAKAGYILSLITGVGLSTSTFLLILYTCF